MILSIKRIRNIIAFWFSAKFFKICATWMQRIVYCREWESKHVSTIFSVSRIISFLSSFGNGILYFCFPNGFNLQVARLILLIFFPRTIVRGLFCTGWRVEYIFDKPFSSSACWSCTRFASLLTICSFFSSIIMSLLRWFSPSVWGLWEWPPISENTHGQNVRLGDACGKDEAKWFFMFTWHES